MQVSTIHQKQSITIFTDGSCHTQLKKGGWASIILIGTEKIILGGSESDTTHHRMEIIAVLESLKYLQNSNQLHHPVSVYSDSQYVVDLLKRRERLIESEYKTKKLKPVRNTVLVKELISFMSLSNIGFLKIKSHQKHSNIESILNREADLLSRQQMREHKNN